MAIDFKQADAERAKLAKGLHARSQKVRRCDDYYEGKHRLAFAGKKFQEAFGGLFQAFADNWCEVVANAPEERLNVIGFRFGDDPKADKDAWSIWQRNELDFDSELVHIEALVTGYGYVLVWADDSGEPVITGESPLECIVTHASGSRRERRAGLKQWIDEDEYAYAILYRGDGLYKFRTSSKVASDDSAVTPLDSAQWEAYEPDNETWPLANPLERVSLVPFYNNPRLIRPGVGVSEIAKVIPIQDAINKLCTDMLVASEFGAFRQRWATGLQMEKDENGNPVFPFKTGPGSVWATEGGDDVDGTVRTMFGDFSETDLDNFVKAVGMFVSHLASQSRTPPHYLDSSADRLSGESIKAAETGLVAKVRRKFRYFGEPWEDVERLGFRVKNDPRADATDAEVVWGDPETRTESQHVDALVKKKELGVPDQQLWEDAGYSPQQIARFEAMRAADQLRALAFAPPPLALPAAPSEPVVPEPVA